MTHAEVQQLSLFPCLRPTIDMICQNYLQIEEVSVLFFFQVVGKFYSQDWQNDWNTAIYCDKFLFQKKKKEKRTCYKMTNNIA